MTGCAANPSCSGFNYQYGGPYGAAVPEPGSTVNQGIANGRCTVSTNTPLHSQLLTSHLQVPTFCRGNGFQCQSHCQLRRACTKSGQYVFSLLLPFIKFCYTYLDGKSPNYGHLIRWRNGNSDVPSFARGYVHRLNWAVLHNYL